MNKLILNIEGLSKSFGKTKVIVDCKLSVRKGEFHSIIGPNGAGKSTLFNLITGIYKPTSGSIKFKGEEIARLRPFEINRKGLSRSFQITNIFREMSVFENIRCSLLWVLGEKYAFWKTVNSLKHVRDRAEQILEQIGMTERRNIIAGTLSYAEQRLLEIGITIGSGAEVILLDEPTAGLSRQETTEMIALIQKTMKGKTLVFVEHNMDVVFAISNHISVLVYGHIIATDEPRMIKENKRVQAAYLGSLEEANRD
ncbi:MAG: ABC transporter ATP-binding protein [Deltaproteobacteria bacterium]|nr:ABC transporter ATP-binding protein [Deltaproteobacteria bacterium]